MEKLEFKDFDDKVLHFLGTSNYYGTLMHSKYCKICKLPEEDKNEINTLFMKNIPYPHIQQVLLDKFSETFNDDNISRSVIQHGKYLPYLISEVGYKSIFRRAKKHLEDTKINDLSVEDKLKVISRIEEEIVKEYANIEFEGISLINVFYKETFPLLMTRLHKEIIEGKAKDIKDVTDASQMVFKMSAAISQVSSITNNNKKHTEENDDVDFTQFDENPNKSNKEKIVSLTEKINKATGVS